MIKEIFLPEKIGLRRLIAQRIVGISSQEDLATLSLVHAKGNKSVVEKLLLQRLEPNTNIPYAQRASDAIKRLSSQIKKCDQVRIGISASVVTFKELDMPFDDIEKIRMVLDYEIESMLPFPISGAVVDFIVTKRDRDQKTARILVAAVQNQDLQAELDIYNQAGVDPNHITVDLFAIYGLYKQISDYAEIEKGSVLVDVGGVSTRIAFLQDGELRLVRSISRGIDTIVKSICEESGLDYKKIADLIQLHGIDHFVNDSSDKIIHKHFINYFNDIQFTLNSFSLKLNFYDEISKILITGKAGHIKGFFKLCSDTLQIPCEAFDWKKIFEVKSIQNRCKNVKTDVVDFSVALGIALVCPEQELFDLRRKSFTLINYKLINKQIITIFVMLFVIFFVIGFRGYLQISALKDAVTKTEANEISRLKAIFPKKRIPKKQNLQTFVQEAQKLVREKTDLWAAFAQERLNPLEIMLELTDIVDRPRNDIYFTDLVITTKARGVVEIDVDGFFKSKRGSGSHFSAWAVIETRFKESSMFVLLEDQMNAVLTENKGIKFSIKLRLREREK